MITFGDDRKIVSMVSCSTSISDDPLLWCEEDSTILFGGELLPQHLSEIDSMEYLEESIDELIEAEVKYSPGLDNIARFRSQSLDALAREESVLWILKVQRFYDFQPLTAYLAVNYMDRFLYSCRLTKTNGWPLQLLSVACVSLAAKMEEPLVPTLLDLQVGSPEFVFGPKTIQRMELLVLNTLEWRLRSITPFNYLGFFTYKLDRTGTFTQFLTSRATEVILCSIQETGIVEYMPSCIAAAALLCAADEIPFTSTVTLELVESCCDGLHKEKINDCLQLMQQVLMVMNNRIRKSPKVLPTLRVTTPATSAVVRSITSSDSSSSPSKRRKLSNFLWVYDETRTRGHC